MKRRQLLGSAGALALAGCASKAPPPRTPDLALPAQWKLEAPFQAARPRDDTPKGPWWQRFGDAQLDALQQQALAASPTLQAAAARLAQARALAAQTASALLPQLGVGLRAARQRISANRPLTNYASTNVSTTQNDFVAAFTVGYEVDLSGRLQRQVEGSQAGVAQAAADLENARLLVAADLAVAYFGLRATDVELDVLARAVELQRRALAFVTARRDGGAASGLDVAQQQALLDNTLTQRELLGRQRAVFEHAVATLSGTPAPAFSLPADGRRTTLPDLSTLPLGVPSDLLERRPDVAAAERAMAVANAQVGAAQAAFFPSFNLAPSVGLESRDLSRLFDAPSLLWSLGVSALQVLFDNGRLQAGVDFARAGHDLAAAGYRRVVLQALQEVEDGLLGLAALQRAVAQAGVAAASAGRVAELARRRYEGGVATSLEVISAQQGQLNAERQLAQLQGQALVLAVFLVKALGGGW